MISKIKNNFAQINFFKTTACILALALTSCGAKDIDKLGDAQSCLDSSTNANAPQCVAGLEGNESAKAYELRCAANFIREGFSDPTKYSNAFSQVGSGSSGGGVSSFMGLITFTSNNNITADTANSATTFDYCLKSGAKGSVLISAFGYLSLSMYNFFYSKSPATCPAAPVAGSYDINTCITSIGSLGVSGLLIFQDLADPTLTNPSAESLSVRASVGSIVVSTYNISCLTSTTNQQLCTSLKNSIDKGGGSSNLSGVGRQFFVELIKPTCGIPCSSW